MMFSKNKQIKNVIVYDDFQSVLYTLNEGNISPNKKWKNLWNGYGSSGVNNSVFFMYPSISTNINDTSSNLVISTQSFANFELNIDVKTINQLRQNNQPNPWEVAWIIFRFTDLTHYYYFTVKINGIELGKYDGGQEIIDQKILYTAETPTLTIGTWSTWKINIINNHIIIYVDNIKVIDYVDNTMSNQLKSGSIGMYNEDALTNFSNVQYILFNRNRLDGKK